ncbi:MAG: Gfo/Idh/MocA family oxidoreductase [bacterium]
MQHRKGPRNDGVSTPRTCVVVGAGIRGREVYGRWIRRHSKRARVVAVAEPNAARRAEMSREHAIPPERSFADWRELLDGPPVADVCLVTTQDRDHTEPAVAALEAGYAVLLEKPMATTPEECRRLVTTAERTGNELRVCHVMRYAPLFQAAHRAIAAGEIGRVLHLEHSENVAYWHFAHSYVRGPWRRRDESSPLILAKSCHDLDIIHWLAGSFVTRVQSFGSRVFFRQESAPPGAPERCTDGCPVAESCLWYAPRLYLDGQSLYHTTQYAASPVIRVAGRLVKRFLRSRFRRWPATVISDDPSREARMQALRTGPFGRCVYRCDNDVPDQQSITLEFENGITATMGLHGFSFLDGRWFRIDGSEGTLQGRFTYAGQELRLHRHEGRSRFLYRTGLDPGGHGQADSALMEAFFPEPAALSESAAPTSLSSAAESLESHLAAFAAERSRVEGRVVELTELRGETA